MPFALSQSDSFLNVRTTLDEDALLLQTFRGTEGMSRMFEFVLTMLSESETLAVHDLVGTSATVTLQRPGEPARHFHGIVARAAYLGMVARAATYTLELTPRLKLLTLGRDRVIYQNLTAPDIVKKVLTEHAVTFTDELTGTYKARDYCVRYDETAFQFVSRLMEEEGIFYFFTFTAQSHTMVLADSTSAYKTVPDAATLDMLSETEDRNRVHAVTRFEVEARLAIKSHSVDDYNFLTPSVSLLARHDGTDGRGADYEYPGLFDAVADGTARARIRVEEHQAESLVGDATTLCHHLLPGFKFTLANHPRADFDQEYLVRSVHHDASGEDYRNTVVTLPHAVTFRPPRVTPRPVAGGSHTAVVVGSSGEEIWTDAHGRIKLHFPWDRVGGNNETSSCWVRVAQMWAGQGWGALYLPRIGQEVVVSYVDGDPERPLVTGSVYNAEQTPPVALPGSSTQSTLLSRSSKTGTAGNELRFEDKKDAEELFMHAQKDMRVSIENDLSTTLVEGSETHTIAKGDRTVKVDTGKETHSVKGTRALEVTGNETHVNKADFTQTVTGNHELKITGNLVIDVTGNITIKSAGNIETKAGGNIVNKAGMNLQNEAGVALSNKGGASMTNDAPAISSKASGAHTVGAGGIIT
ncbi:MAG: type VI secretion system tip protein VgrG, partial [Comamonadaceae bacterium]